MLQAGLLGAEADIRQRSANKTDQEGDCHQNGKHTSRSINAI